MSPPAFLYRHILCARRNNAVLGAVFLASVSVAHAQVYGVAKKTTVVKGPNGNVAAVSKTTVVSGGGTATKTTVVTAPHGTVAASGTTVVVAGGSTLPHGYIAVLPGGYHAVTVSGVRYYTVGGIYYRPQMYQGRTVYVAVRL
ncbi:MAG: hypothetical protein WA673_00115 [Candidatus Acidiferrales bacterium]